MQTTNIVDENIKRIGELFPNCLTERLNDEGKLYGLPVNLVLGSPEREILDTIQGDVFFASCDDEGTTIGLTDEQVNWVKQKLDSGHFAMAQTEHGLEFVPVWVYASMAS